jgi:methylthioribose-1-phosphate isomerase
MRVAGCDYRTVWLDGSTVRAVNQALLPHRFEIAALATHGDTAGAIRDMVVRGAPAIGAAGGFGMAQVFLEAPSELPARVEYVEQGYQRLRLTRPTAQNLFYALERVRQAGLAQIDPAQAASAAMAEALAYADQDAAACLRIGQLGAPLIREGATVLTHCNAGWLACVDWGTALAPIYVAHRAGRKLKVLADETRPRLQGMSLTAWELAAEGVSVEIIADNAAGFFMRSGGVDLVITGADRIAANGDTANKIGTYEKALCARASGIPFYIAAPASTFDLNCPDGQGIPIEERSGEELTSVAGLDEQGRLVKVRIAPAGATARNPAFDVTPAELITGIITEKGIIRPTAQDIARVIAPAIG